MPNFNVQLVDIDSTAKHYIVMSVVDRLVDILDLRSEDIILNLPYSNATQVKATAGLTRTEDFGQLDRIFVDVEERRIEDSLTTRGSGFAIANPIFVNKTYATRIYPAYTTHEFTLGIKVRTASRGYANTWINRLHRQASHGGDAFTVSADYHYVLPPVVLGLLTDIYQTSQLKGPIVSFGDFLRDGFIKAITTSEGSFLVRQTAARIVCIIDAPADITPEKSENAGAWLATMNIKFTVQIPDSLDLVYAPIIANTLLPEKWWQSMLCPGESDELDALGDVHVTAQDAITPLEQHIPIPVYLVGCDTPEYPKGTRYYGEEILISGYFELNESDILTNTVGFNLADLGDNIKLNPRILEYIKKSYLKRPRGDDSIFRVYVYDNYLECDRKNSTINQNLDYTLKRSLDLNHLYAFGISVMTDWTYLSEDGKDILKEFPDVVINVIVDFRPDVANNFPDIYDKISVIDNDSSWLPADTGWDDPNAGNNDIDGGRYPWGDYDNTGYDNPGDYKDKPWYYTDDSNDWSKGEWEDWIIDYFDNINNGGLSDKVIDELIDSMSDTDFTDVSNTTGKSQFCNVYTIANNRIIAKR